MPEVQTTSEEDLARRFSSSQAWQPNLSFVQAAKFELEHRQKPTKLASRPPLVQASGESGRRCCRNLSSCHLLSLEIFCTGVSFTYIYFSNSVISFPYIFFLILWFNFHIFKNSVSDWFLRMLDYWYLYLIQAVISVSTYSVCICILMSSKVNDYICTSNFFRVRFSFLFLGGYLRYLSNILSFVVSVGQENLSFLWF